MEGELVEWESLPEVLKVEDLRRVLRLGRDGAYLWMRQHPGLVIRAGSAKRVPREGLRRFLARDPEVVALAFTDPYSRNR
jgi:alpha-beta hydrolase superfamily lysophospholipase